MFCSQIHEHSEEHKKGNNIFCFSVIFFYSTIFNYFSFLWSISMLDEYFALRFMNTVKNTKKVTTFLLLCDFLFFYYISHYFSYLLYFFCWMDILLSFMNRVKNTKKVSTFFSFLRFFVLLPYSTVLLTL